LDSKHSCSSSPINLPPLLPRRWDLTDIWGIPIEPPKYRP
jgi:hypothetical protein